MDALSSILSLQPFSTSFDTVEDLERYPRSGMGRERPRRSGIEQLTPEPGREGGMGGLRGRVERRASAYPIFHRARTELEGLEV